MLAVTALALVWTGHVLTWAWLAERLAAAVIVAGAVLPGVPLKPGGRTRLVAAGLVIALAVLALR
ncbi:hypothetical protein GCM10009789_36410 [Kribbella sancticallisti]|uniref:Uncharacterized protein n=1 Tax=Kribbella sancticallisti TaxID=460087 RepID=A0ABN2DNA5_9ACTN